MKYVCQNCGDTVDGEEDWENWDCSYLEGDSSPSADTELSETIPNCGGRVVPDEESEVPLNGELEALIERWRIHAEVGNTEYAKGVQDCFRVCANELEELLDYDNDD